MRRCPTSREIACLMDGTAGESERTRLKAHLEGCTACRRLCEYLSDMHHAALDGRLPVVTGTEASAAFRCIAGDGARPRRVEVNPAADRLSLFFAGLLDAEQAARLLMEGALLAGQKGGLPDRTTREEAAQALCALRCEAAILRGTCAALDEEALLEEAISAGWFVTGAGMPLKHLGRLLASHGMAVERYFHADVEVLRHALDRGYALMAAVDAGELRPRSRLAILFERIEDCVAKIPDHCLLVTGVTRTAAGEVVVVTDPAGAARRREIPVADFLEAWEDSDFFLLAAKAQSA